MFLTKKVIGLDIADQTMEVAELKGFGLHVKVKNLGRIKLEAGIVERGRIKDEIKLSQALKQLFKMAKPRAITGRKIIFALPESQVYLRNFILSAHSKKAREELIKTEVVKNIPLVEDGLVYDYRVLEEKKDGTEVLVAAASKDVVKEWLRFFKKNKFEVQFLDVEILASFRDLFSTLPKEPVCLVDLGATTTYLAVFDKNGLHYEEVINIAGNNLTTAVAGAVKLDEKKAEAAKIKDGLKSKSKLVVKALEKELSTISKEIITLVEYFKEQTGMEVQKLVLIGGTSQLKGLNKYLEENVKLPVQIGNAKSLDVKVPLEYIEAIGLGLRGLHNHWESTDPSIPILKDLKEEKPLSKKTNLVIDEEKISGQEEEAQKTHTRLLLIILLLVIIVGGLLVAYLFWQHSQEVRDVPLQIQQQLEQIPEFNFNVQSSSTEAVTVTSSNFNF